jgi:hypothetical protein
MHVAKNVSIEPAIPIALMVFPQSVQNVWKGIAHRDLHGVSAPGYTPPQLPPAQHTSWMWFTPIVMVFISHDGVALQVSSKAAMPSSPGMPLAVRIAPHCDQNGPMMFLQPFEQVSVVVGYPPEH